MGVENKGPAVFDALKHIVGFHIFWFVTCYIICWIYQIGRFNGRFAKTKVRDCNAAGFFGIIGKISLGKHIRVITNDFDCALVCAYGSVSSQPPEFALHSSFRSHIKSLFYFQGSVCNIINNTNGKVISRTGWIHVIKYSFDHAWVKLFGAKTISSTDYYRHFTSFHIGRAYVLI